MAMTLGDILQITDVQTYLGQQVLNIYFYELTELGASVTYQNVIDNFQNVIVQEVRQIQADDLNHIRVIVKNVSNDLDIFEEASSFPGALTDAPLPSFVALSYRLIRTTALTRHGAKRIAGPTEAVVFENGLNPTFNTLATDVAVALATPLQVDAGGAFDFTARPVIVGRFPEGHAQAGELDLSKINPISSASLIRVSSQTTRRAGRGV